MIEYINKEQLLAHLFSKKDENIDIFAEIANFPVETFMDRWISVEESFPDIPLDMEGYLCRFCSGSDDSIFYSVMTFNPFKAYNDFWHKPINGNRITHWMPFQKLSENKLI